MAILIQMPLAVCRGFIGRCPLDSREYEILKNSVISHVPEYLREGNVVEFFLQSRRRGTPSSSRKIVLSSRRFLH
jgi:hypothetical protein